MATVLELAQGAAYEMGVTPPSSLIATTQVELQWRYLLYSVARDLRSERFFPQQKKTYTISITSGRAAYPMPEDFYAGLLETQYDRSDSWELIGPISDREWNYRLYGPGNSSNRTMYRIFGPDRLQGSATLGGQFKIDPTPSSSMTFSFDYITSNLFLPPNWSAGVVVSAGSYRNANGNIYRTTAGGTTGALCPSTTTTQSDGAVTWDYISAPYETIVVNTDLCLFDDDVVIEGLKYKYRRSKDMAYDDLKASFESKIAKCYSRWSGSYIGRMDRPKRGSQYSVPSGSWSI